MNQRLSAFDFLTSSLATSASVLPASLVQQIRAGSVPWETVVELANDHLMTPALWGVLRKASVNDALPEDLCSYLLELYGLARERNEHLKTQLLQAVRKLNAAAIEPLLLKGAVHLVTDTYGDPAARMMTDLDLLVPIDLLEQSVTQLEALGYSAQDIYQPSDHRHAAPLFRPGDYAAVELHSELVSPQLAEILPPEPAWAEARRIEIDDMAMYVLSPTYRVLNNIVHSQIIDRYHAKGTIPLRSLYEVFMENKRCADEIDWGLIRERMRAASCQPVLAAYLYQAHRLFEMPLPSQVPISSASVLYYHRCRAQLAWPWLETLVQRLERMSTENMVRKYSCHGWLPVNIARLKFVAGRLAVRYKGKQSTPDDTL